MRRLTAIAAFIVLALVLASPANATPIGPNCGTCQGGIYTLTYNTVPVSQTATTVTYQVTLTINTTGYNGGGVAIDNVAVKVSSSLSAATLVSAPGGVGMWNLTVGGISASGCNGSGSGFECADATANTAAPLPHSGTYSWVFNLTMPTNSLLTGNLGGSIKVRYVDAKGKKVGALVSEDITIDSFTPQPPPNNPVPEPSSLALLGTGLMSVAGMVRRRFAK